VTVTAAIATGGGTLGGTLTATTIGNGVATFTNLAITGTVGDRTLSFSATGLTAVTSGTITVTAGAATQLVFSVQPITTTAGAAITPAVQVTAEDGSGNTATGFTGNITVTIGTNPGGGTLSGTATVAAAGGVASFANLSINKAGAGYTLTATGAGSVTSAAFDITPGTAAALVFTVQPTNTVAGAAITPEVEVTAQDASGNTATGFSGNITVAIGTNPGGGTLSGTTTIAASAGVATFSTLSINKAGTGYTLTATGVGTVTSSAFNITAASASKMAIQAGDGQQATVGTAVPIPPAVILRDQFDNAVSGVAVTFAVLVNNGTVNPTTPVTTGADGIAAVTSWTLGTLAGPNSLSATASGGGIIPNPVTFTATGTPAAPSASQSSVSAAPSPITASSGASASTITVTVRDAFGNAVSGVLVTLSATGTGNTLTPSGTTDGSGQMTGTLSSTVAETKTITAKLGSVAIASQPTVTVDPADASQLVFTVQPSNVVVGSLLSSVVVTALDAFGNTATGFTGNVQIAIGNDASVVPPATLGGTLTVAAASGVATFADLTIDKLGIGYTLVVTAAGVPTGATSNPFNVVTIL
jgi:hypothetical protein